MKGYVNGKVVDEVEFMEDEEKKKLWRRRTYFYKHYHLRDKTSADLGRIQDEIDRLVVWKNMLSKNWEYHRHREFNDERKNIK